MTGAFFSLLPIFSFGVNALAAFFMIFKEGFFSYTSCGGSITSFIITGSIGWTGWTVSIGSAGCDCWIGS